MENDNLAGARAAKAAKAAASSELQAQVDRLTKLAEEQATQIQALLAGIPGQAAPADFSAVTAALGGILEKQEALMDRQAQGPAQPDVAWSYKDGDRLPQPAGGYASLLKTAGWRDRADKGTKGKGIDEIPEAAMYRITAPAIERREGHPRYGQLCYNGITSVVLADEDLSNKYGGGDSATSFEGGRQVHLRFANGVALTDDREAALAFKTNFGYKVEVENAPVKFINMPVPEAGLVTAAPEKVGAAG